LATHSKLQEIGASKLMQDWSPQEISGWLQRQYPNNESLRVSHETIYRSLFIQPRGALKQELMRHLRSHKKLRFSASRNQQKIRKPPKLKKPKAEKIFRRGAYFFFA
jgi:IS30 family transposase